VQLNDMICDVDAKIRAEFEDLKSFTTDTEIIFFKR
ncbi:hypothetical protein THOM_0197, partial [Trachipleistophora hominis]